MPQRSYLALETTAAAVGAQLAGGNYSLCHGLAGRAGTAYFYLRLHDPSRPSILLLRPESFAAAG